MAGGISATPSILKWARLSSGKSLAEVSRILGKEEEEILRWEAGAASPTYSSLEKMAYQIYKRPLAIFFFPDPPTEPTPSKEFRTLPDAFKDKFHSDTVLAFRQAEVFQLSLREIHEDEKLPERIFDKFSFNENSAIVKVSEQVRKYFDVSIQHQKGFNDAEKAFKFWRSKVEAAGVHVFKRPFKQTDLSGFCLVDADFPVIIVNNKNSFTRQLFTLFHELAHVLSRVSSITDITGNVTKIVLPSFQNFEVACNKFANEFLVPDSDFFKLYSGNPDEDKIEYFAQLYSVSRELILRKLLDREIVTESFYNKKRREWNDQLRESKSNSGNYYATQSAYLGDRYLNLAFSKYYSGKIPIERLSEYLNVKVKNIPKLESYVLNR